MRPGRFLILSLLAVLLAGCFPLTVSVGPDGRVALPRQEGIFLLDLKEGASTTIYKCEEGKEVSWVQWAPKGKQLLYVVGNEVYTTTPDGKQQKLLYTASGTMGYCLWSPDEKWISITELVTKLQLPEEETKEGGEQKDSGEKKDVPEKPDKDKEKKQETGLEKESLPQLTIIDARTGEVKQKLENIFFIHRWMPDSKQVAILHLIGKEAESGAFTGEIALFGVNDGALTSLAKVKSTESWLDVAPSGKAIYFTADSAGDKEEGEAQTSRLFCFFPGDPARKPKSIAASVGSVAVSPDSGHLLISKKGDSGTELLVCDENGANEKVIASGIAEAAADMGGGKIIPVWLNNEEILYWKYVTVLSPGGKSLKAYTVRRDGTMTANIQNRMEEMVIKADRQKK